MARNQPTYDFLAGGEVSPPARQPLRETLKQSTVSRADINNENIRAQLNTLQYELDAIKQERELTTLHHAQELRDAQSRGEADFKRAQAAEAASTAAKKRADALSRELREAEDRATNEKTLSDKKARDLEGDARALREELEDAQAELSSKDRQSKHAFSELEQRHATLQASVEGIQQDLEGKVIALQNTQQRLSQGETEVGELENEVLKLKAQTGDSDILAIVKKELGEQVSYIRNLEATNRDQLSELKQYRKMQKGIEVVEEEKRALESRIRMMDDLRKELAEAQLQKRILEDEKRGWTSYLEAETRGGEEMRYDTPEQMAKAFLQERLEKLSLVDKLGAVQPELSVKEENIRSLEDDKARLSAELEKMRTAGGIGITAPDNKARLRSERQKNLVTKEVEYLRAQLKTMEAEEAEFNPDQVNEEHMRRVHELEDMIEQFRNEVQGLNAELTKVESQAPAVQSPKKRPREEEEADDERLGELRRKARALQDDIDKLLSRNQYLEAELKVSTAQLTSLRKTTQTRILELRNNPTAEVEAIKMTTLQTLREENAALLAQLSGSGNKTSKVVPISTLNATKLELDDAHIQIKQHEKKTLRLKQIFSQKSLEFREAVCSILGWKLDFLPNGRVKATSILYPTSVGGGGEEEENSIVFDGENGTMKVSGGPRSAFAGEIRGLIEFWVEGRKEIPGFLAACTLEFYDRSTKAAKA